MGVDIGPKFPGSDEAISPGHEVRLKQSPDTPTALEQRGPTMLTIILNSIYRQFLRRSLPAMRRLAAG
jgi:hypothetical protein